MLSPLISIVITLQAIEVVLVSANKRQVIEEAIKLWVENLKDVAYKTDNVYETNNVLTEWNTAIVKLQNHENPNSSKVSEICRERERFTVDWEEIVWRSGERKEGGGRQGREGERIGGGWLWGLS
ncbi:hypothetical protein LguiB_029002 [Lonicera macranthoides]